MYLSSSRVYSSKQLRRAKVHQRLFSFQASSMVEVTRHNFKSLLSDFEQSIDASSFVAIDTEFTGLSASSNTKEQYLDTMEERYEKIRDTGSKFNITQFGLSCVQPCAEKGWKIDTYNFYVFPRTYQSNDERFWCQASSMQFMAEHGFDFNKCIGDGIGYMKSSVESVQREKLQKEISSLKDSSSRKKKLVLNSARDKEFYKTIEQQIGDWLNDTGASSEPLYIQERNPFLRMVIHHISKNEFRDQVFSRKKGRNMIEIVSANAEERKVLIEENIGQLQEALEDAVGFSKVIGMISAAKKPVIGHNALLDFVYLYRQFCDDLPPTLAEFKQQLNEVFPVVYDTKAMVRQTQLRDHFEDTSLGALFDSFKDRMDPHPSTLLDSSCEQYIAAATSTDGTSLAHEAGYDAYMTAIVYLGIASVAEQDWKVAEKFKLSSAIPSEVNSLSNKINLMRSDVEFLDLSDMKQECDRSCVYAVSVQGSAALECVDKMFLNHGVLKVMRAPGQRNVVIVFLSNALSVDNIASLKQDSTTVSSSTILDIVSYDTHVQSLAPCEDDKEYGVMPYVFDRCTIS